MFFLQKPWPSHSCRHLLREIIVSTILVPAMDFVSDPDTLNKLILTALEPKTDASADDIDVSHMRREVPVEPKILSPTCY